MQAAKADIYSSKFIQTLSRVSIRLDEQEIANFYFLLSHKCNKIQWYNYAKWLHD